MTGEQEGDAAYGDAEYHGKAGHPADGTAASAAAHLGAGEAPAVRMRIARKCNAIFI